MTTPTFPLSYGPVFPVEASFEPRLNIAQFGDGYEQAVGDGINTIRPQTEVVWNTLTKAEQDTVINFLIERGGAKSFMWTYPGDAAPTRWVCRKWSRVFIGPNNYGVKASFMRSFNPDN